MAQGVGSTVLDEPAPQSRRERRERRERGRPESRSRRAPGTVPSENGDGGADASRRARRARSEHRSFWFVLMPAVALVLALCVVLGAVVRSNSDASPARAEPSGAAAPARSLNTLLLAHRGADGRIDLLVLTGASGRAGSVLLFPVATQVEVPSLGPQALADLANQGDRALLQTTVENLLGVKVAKTVELDDAGLNFALRAAAPLPVDLHRAVKFAGSTDAVIAAGSHRTTAAEAARLLVSQQPGSELDRLVTVQDVLDGWLRRLRNPKVARATVRVQPSLAGLLAVAKASDRRTDTLPVESVSTGGGEQFEARAADVAHYVAGAFPQALLRVGKGRPRVEILNGTGAVGLAQTIAARIVPAGGQVTLTGNVGDFGVHKTQVVYYQDSGRAAATRLMEALGCGALAKADKPLGVVDVTIIAGADCFRTGAAPGQ